VSSSRRSCLPNSPPAACEAPPGTFSVAFSVISVLTQPTSLHCFRIRSDARAFGASDCFGGSSELHPPKLPRRTATANQATPDGACDRPFMRKRRKSLRQFQDQQLLRALPQCRADFRVPSWQRFLTEALPTMEEPGEPGSPREGYQLLGLAARRARVANGGIELALTAQMHGPRRIRKLAPPGCRLQ